MANMSTSDDDEKTFLFPVTKNKKKKAEFIDFYKLRIETLLKGVVKWFQTCNINVPLETLKPLIVD